MLKKVRKSAWISLILVLGLLLSGCVIPRTVGKGIQGAGKFIEGAGDAMAAPFEQ